MGKAGGRERDWQLSGKEGKKQILKDLKCPARSEYSSRGDTRPSQVILP